MKKTAMALAASLVLCAGTMTGCSLDFNFGRKSSSAAEEPAQDGSSVLHTTSDGQPFQRGSVTDNVYSSDFSGLSVTLPEGWVFYSDKELMKLMNLSMEYMDTDEGMKELLEQTVIYDAMMIDKTTGSNVIIGFENLAKTTPNPEAYSIDDYIEALDLQFAADLTQTRDKTAAEDVIVAGEPYKKLTYVVYRTNDNLTQIYYLRKIDNFVHMIIITPKDPEIVPEIESHFLAK